MRAKKQYWSKVWRNQASCNLMVEHRIWLTFLASKTANLEIFVGWLHSNWFIFDMIRSSKDCGTINLEVYPQGRASRHGAVIESRRTQNKRNKIHFSSPSHNFAVCHLGYVSIIWFQAELGKWENISLQRYILKSTSSNRIFQGMLHERTTLLGGRDSVTLSETRKPTKMS